ncbi:MAG TPA: ATP-dependent DNA helicase PcrA, partial [Firmicutes bacterium]|nr:ATP-dependent DNA helicase PcrA [Bacillota bacterium]
MENVTETEILAGLNEPQKSAVQHTTGPLLVLAGAGSGKTRVLTHRAAYLIRERGVDPGEILAVTFTNKAAEEMRQRIVRLVGPAAARVWVMTFHSACVRILREDGDAIGLDKHFVIYDTVDQLAVVRKALASLNLSDKEHNPRAILAGISSAKNDLQNAQEFMDKAADFWSKTVAKVYREYQTILSRNQALDFDDLIMKTVALFKSVPLVLDKYQERFKYIMVDEYQDTNHAQYMLVNALAAKHRNLCVVGDDDQSIYGFRKADIRNILEFERDYPEVTVVKLEQNYRSTGKILDSANSVVSNNRGRKKKRLWTENPAGDNICLYKAEDEKAEAHFIISEIARMAADEGRPFKDFAILYRANAQSRALEEAFTARGLPYRILGGLRFYDRKEIRDLLAYLRLIANPADMISFERAVAAPRRGIGA